jgi:hypothetical protein
MILPASAASLAGSYAGDSHDWVCGGHLQHGRRRVARDTMSGGPSVTILEVSLHSFAFIPAFSV